MSSTDATENDHVPWIRGLPKAEIHLHLEGTVTPTTLVALSQRHDETPLTMDDAIAMYRYTDFLHFLSTFKSVCDRLQTPEDYALITREMIKGLATQGVVHAEVFLAWGGALRSRTHLDFGQVMESVEAARSVAEAEFGVSVSWIIDATRQWGPDDCAQIVNLAAKWKEIHPSIVGIGIGGDEARGPCHTFKAVYAEAKSKGLRLTAHAGESTGPVEGPKSMWDALDIGAERIGHGICAAFDNELMEELKHRQTPLEICVTSNLKTGVCETADEHPLKLFLDKGLMVTINSDDPAMFGSNLLEEYILVQKEQGLTRDQMKQLATNAVMASFLTDEKKHRLCARIEEYDT